MLDKLLDATDDKELLASLAKDSGEKKKKKKEVAEAGGASSIIKEQPAHTKKL